MPRLPRQLLILGAALAVGVGALWLTGGLPGQAGGSSGSAAAAGARPGPRLDEPEPERGPDGRRSGSRPEGVTAIPEAQVARAPLEERRMHLEVKDEAGKPLESFRYEVRMRAPVPGRRPTGQASSRPGGRIALEPPEQVFWVVVDTADRMRFSAGPFEPHDFPPLLEVVLAQLVVLDGVVIGRDGPMEGILVELLLETFTRAGTERSWNTEEWEQPARTDIAGRFRLTAREPGTYYVEASSKRAPLASLGPFQLGPGAFPPTLVIELPGARDGAVPR